MLDMRPAGLAATCTPARALSIIALLALATLGAGCATLIPREVVPERLADEAELTGMPNIRVWGDASAESLTALLKAERLETGALAEARRRSGQQSPELNVVAISGGGDNGAFAAGLLVGWSDAGTRPDFDLVTGVSAGALVAPFVYLGRNRDAKLKEIFTKYTRSDIYSAGIMTPLFGAGLVDSAPLENLIANYVDEPFLREVARERRKGRVLLIGTTNLDAERPVLWDMGRIAMSGHPQALGLFRKVLLASASIPGAFPPVRIKVRAEGRTYEELHVDGGVTQQVFPGRPGAWPFDEAIGEASVHHPQRENQSRVGSRGGGDLLHFTTFSLHPDQEPGHRGSLSYLRHVASGWHRLQPGRHTVRVQREMGEAIRPEIYAGALRRRLPFRIPGISLDEDPAGVSQEAEASRCVPASRSS
jgi:hypothetical protein